MIRFTIGLIKFLVAFCITPNKKDRIEREQIMLISEKGKDARDNGYHLFLWIKQHHPECRTYYVISNDSPDRHRLDKYADSIIEYGSLRACVFFWRAKYLVSTHQRAGHTPIPFVLSRVLGRYFGIYKGKKVVFLQHGITKDFIPRMTYENTNYDLFVCGALPEWQYMTSVYGYPSAIAQYTGFCRYDNLLTNDARKRQILVMPTWRKYLEHNFTEDSKYVSSYKGFLHNEQLQSLLDRYDYTLIFYLHHMAQPYIHLFRDNKLSKRITIADAAHYDVQTLLKDSALLVTDYSSVYFDFAYMKKPIIFYQFDYDEYRAGHFNAGWLDYKNSFGATTTQESDLVAHVEYYLTHDMQMEPHYQKFVDYCFPIRDSDNCQRVYDAIINC